MARPRTIPDAVVHDAVLALIRLGGDKAVTFSAVAARAGLAASSLAERHGSVAGMIADARNGIWDRVEAATTVALAQAPMTAKGATGLLKALSGYGVPPVSADPMRAGHWRATIEAALAQRLGGGTRGRESAAILFAVWQGQLAWGGVGGKLPRLKDVLRRLD